MACPSARAKNVNTAQKLFRSPLLWLLVAALAVRLVAGIWWQARVPAGARFAFGDSDSYWTLAGCIARGDAYEFGAPPAQVFRTPGYPLVLAGLFLAYGDEPPVAAARVLNALLGTLAVWGVHALALRLFDRRAALVAAVIIALYPGAIGMSVFVLSEAAFCPLLMAQLIVTTAAWQSAGPKGAWRSHWEQAVWRGWLRWCVQAGCSSCRSRSSPGSCRDAISADTWALDRLGWWAWRW